MLVRAAGASGRSGSVVAGRVDDLAERAEGVEVLAAAGGDVDEPVHRLDVVQLAQALAGGARPGERGLGDLGGGEQVVLGQPAEDLVVAFGESGGVLQPVPAGRTPRPDGPPRVAGSGRAGSVTDGSG